MRLTKRAFARGRASVWARPLESVSRRPQGQHRMLQAGAASALALLSWGRKCGVGTSWRPSVASSLWACPSERLALLAELPQSAWFSPLFCAVPQSQRLLLHAITAARAAVQDHATWNALQLATPTPAHSFWRGARPHHRIAARGRAASHTARASC